MPAIPNSVNQVTLQFAPEVNNDALQVLINGLTHAISSDVAPGHRLTSVWISSVRDQHTCPSRHVTGNAADLSRINGKRISTHYSTDPEVKAIVDALQNKFETYLPHRRENFGPTIKLKEGQPHDPGGHDDHIHFSVSGPHNCPQITILQRILRWFKGKKSEVCNHLGD